LNSAVTSLILDFGETEMKKTEMNDLALKLDKVFRDFGPYEYADSDITPDTIAAMLAADPYGVIRALCGMIESLTE